MGFNASFSPSQRPGSASLPSRQRLCDETPYATHRFTSMPRFAFDPDAVLSQSIQEQLERLHRGPDFDASARVRPASASVPYRSSSTRGQADRHGLRGRYTSSDLTASLAPRDVLATPSPLATPRSKRPASSLPASSHTHAYTAPRRHLAVTAAVPPVIASAVADPSRSVEWRRQRRKEELVENGLEPMQNLIGLGSYFVQRPHFTYHPLAASSSGAVLPDGADLRRVPSMVTGGATGTVGGGGRGSVYTASRLPRPSSSTPVAVQARTPQCRPPSTTMFGILPGPIVHAHAPHERTASMRRDVRHSNPARGSGVAAGTTAAAAPHDSAETSGSAARRRGRHGGSQASHGSRDSSNSHSIGSRGTASSASAAESADVFFDEDPITAQLASQSHPAPAHASSSSKGAAAVAGADVAGPPAPLTAADVFGQPATAPTRGTAPQRRPHERRGESLSLLSSSTTDHRAAPVTTSAGAPPPPPAPSQRAGGSTTQAPPPRSSASASPATFEAPAGTQARERRRMAETLVRQLLRLRLEHQYLPHHSECPCGVCDGSRRTPSAYARGRQVATQRVRPPSAAAPVMRPARHSRFSQPAARGSRRPSREAVASAPLAHYDAATMTELERRGTESDAFDRFFRTHRRCEYCEGPAPRMSDSAAPLMVPAPPSRSRDRADSHSRRGGGRRQRLASSAARLSGSGPQEQPQTSNGSLSVPFTTPTPPPHHVAHYYQQTQPPPTADAAARRLAVPYQETPDTQTHGRQSRSAQDADVSGLPVGTDGHHELLALLRALLKDSHQEPRPVAAETAALPSTEIPDHDIEALLHALRAEVPMDDATYAALLRLLFGSSRASPTPSPAPTTAATSGTAAAQATQSGPHPPAPVPPPQRVDVGVETAATSSPSSVPSGAIHVHATDPPRSATISSIEASTNGSAPSPGPERPVSSPLEAVTAVVRCSVEAAAQTDTDSTEQREADFAALLHASVVQAQLRVLEELEASLRAGMMREQAEEYGVAYVSAVTNAEVGARRRLASQEEGERDDLARCSRYRRDCILVAEAALKEWATASAEEEVARRSLIADAAAAKAAVVQSVAAAEALRKGVASLDEAEERGRRAITWTEALVRQELQSSICAYTEAYAREDIEFDEELGHRALLRARVISAPAALTVAKEEEQEEEADTPEEPQEEVSARDDAQLSAAAESPAPVPAVETDHEPLQNEATSPFHEIDDVPAAERHDDVQDTASTAPFVADAKPLAAAPASAPSAAPSTESSHSATELPLPLAGAVEAAAHEPPSVTHTSSPLPVSVPDSTAAPPLTNEGGAVNTVDEAEGSDKRADTPVSEDGCENSGVVSGTSSTSLARRRRVRPAVRHRGGVATAIVLDDVGELVDDEAGRQLLWHMASGSSLDHSHSERHSDVVASGSPAATPTPAPPLGTAPAMLQSAGAALVSGSPTPDAALYGDHQERDHDSIVENEDDASLPPTSSVRARKGASDGAVSVTESHASVVNGVAPAEEAAHVVTEATSTGHGGHGTSASASHTDVSHNPNAKHAGAPDAYLSEEQMMEHFESSIDTRRFMSPLPTRSEVGSPNRPHPHEIATDDNEADEERELTEYEVAPTDDAEEPANEGDEDGGDEVAAHGLAEYAVTQPSWRGHSKRFSSPSLPPQQRKKSRTPTLSSSSLSSPHLRDLDESREEENAPAMGDERSAVDDDEYARYVAHHAPSGGRAVASAAETVEEVPPPHRGDSGDELISPVDLISEEYAEVETDLVRGVVGAGRAADSHHVGVEKTSDPATVLASLKAKHPLHYADREAEEGDGEGDAAPDEEGSPAPQGDGEAPRAPLGTDGESTALTERSAVGSAAAGYYESLENDTLTPDTRMLRGRCWEENGTAARWPRDGDGAGHDHLAVDMLDESSSAETQERRPETPEFVRHLLAVQREQRAPAHTDAAATAAPVPAQDAHEGKPTHGVAPPPAATRDSAVRSVTPPVRSCRSDDEEYEEEDTYRSYESSSRSGVPEEHHGPNGHTTRDARGGASGTTGDYIGPARLVKARHVMPTSRPSQPTRPPFPWESKSAEAQSASATASAPLAMPASPHAPRRHGGREDDTHVRSSLVSLRDLEPEERGGISGAPDRFGGLAVRVPSPHPCALVRDSGDYLTEEEEEEDGVGRAAAASLLDDTRQLHSMPDASLGSEELRRAPLPVNNPVQLIDSFTDGKIGQS